MIHVSGAYETSQEPQRRPSNEAAAWRAFADASVPSKGLQGFPVEGESEVRWKLKPKLGVGSPTPQ